MKKKKSKMTIDSLTRSHLIECGTLKKETLENHAWGRGNGFILGSHVEVQG